MVLLFSFLLIITQLSTCKFYQLLVKILFLVLLRMSDNFSSRDKLRLHIITFGNLYTGVGPTHYNSQRNQMTVVHKSNQISCKNIFFGRCFLSFFFLVREVFR